MQLFIRHYQPQSLCKLQPTEANAYSYDTTAAFETVEALITINMVKENRWLSKGENIF